MGSATTEEQRWQQARLARDARFDGRFFVAVTSTGIFCRPVCVVRMPKEENVRYFEFAEGAMAAGYRPCLRCRPDSAPHSPAWLGSQSSINRAMALLTQYPELEIATISDKLGITSRYLHKLFVSRVGTTPKQFQLNHQLLCAKQLLHQTPLSIEQIAQTCGFQSTRRLQDNMQKQLKLTPSQIRKQSAPPVDEQVLHINLSYRPPYDWQGVQRFLKAREIVGMEQVNEETYSRTFVVKGASGWFSARHDATNHQFAVKIYLSDWSKTQAVITNIKRVLDLFADPMVISDSLALTGIQATTPGIRIPSCWNGFEAAVRAVLGQQVSVKGAVSQVNSLVEMLGDSASVLGEDRLWFPAPERIAQSDLMFLKMPDGRRQALRRLADYIATSGNTEPSSAWLDIKGIGPWTLAYAKLRGSEDTDVWLDSDLVIKKACAKQAIAAQYGQPWRSYLTMQLWQHASES